MTDAYLPQTCIGGFVDSNPSFRFVLAIEERPVELDAYTRAVGLPRRAEVQHAHWDRPTESLLELVADHLAD